MPLAPAHPRHSPAKLKLGSGVVASSVAGLVVLVSGWFVVVGPAWSGANNTADLERVQNGIAAIERERADLVELNRRYGSLAAADELRLKLLLPDSEDLPNLIAEFEGIVTKSGFRIVNLGLASIPPATGGSEAGTAETAELQVGLSVGTGSYQDLKRLLSALESDVRLLQVTSITFSVGRSGTGYVFNLRTPYLPKRSTR